ncbi:hypothetical protein FSP39_022302 [Pinctada imbricata]|uniref:Repressor of RNA polymerase III transcription MAF1 homolog n=2 Tax=Pinctada TaxID=50425 RepID=A0AA88XK50_PINIB|nr:hypothetical protein FSP39_022302 [Pinctada imbricata]
MKLLENSLFEQLSGALNVQVESSMIEGRIESYSCKMAGNDKKLYKLISQEGGVGPEDLQALSPPQTQLSLSPNKYSRSAGSDGEGYLCDTISTKTLFYLISTLNASFNPDYDFSNAKSEEFSKEPSIQFVATNVDSQLSATMGDQYRKFSLWAAIDEEINLKECDIYSYNPDLASDPYGEEGCIWSFNYFFYNRKLKRIVFFTCKASSVLAPYDSGIGGDGEMFDDTDTMEFSQENHEYLIPTKLHDNLRKKRIAIFIFLVCNTVLVIIQSQAIYSHGNGNVDRLQRTVFENEWRMNEKLKQLERKLRDISQSQKGSGDIEARLQRQIEKNDNKLEELAAINSSYIAGKHHNRTGSGANTLCLHRSPKWTVYSNGTQGARAHIYGGGYESDDGDPDNLLPGYLSRQEDGQLAFCAVCRTKLQRVTIMIPGTNECEVGWTKEYEGLLMANKDGEFDSTEYICVDRDPTYYNKLNNGQFLLYSTEVKCGALPCLEYVDGRELTCVVCSG